MVSMILQPIFLWWDLAIERIRKSYINILSVFLFHVRIQPQQLSFNSLNTTINLMQ